MLSLRLLPLVEEAQRLGFAIPLDVSKKGRICIGLTLRFASIAVHPKSGHLFLLSSMDRTLLVVNRAGRLLHLQQLDRDLFPQPEGMTFLPDGELLISNEGQGSPPTLLRFAQRTTRG